MFVKKLAAIWLIALSATSALCANIESVAPTPTLTTDTSIAAEGYFVLSWDLAALSEDVATNKLVLQQAAEAEFTQADNILIAPSGRMTITGLPDGTYYYRAGTASGWSEVLQVSVRHHSLQRAFVIFTMGLLMFAVLAAVIFIGNRNSGAEHG